MSDNTPDILELFRQISAIPRCSKQEDRIAGYLCRWAEDNGFVWRRDGTGNLVVEVPANPGGEAASGVVIQGHMDMVCEKNPESSHDFNRDPILPILDGDWLRADGTTLGADNGIGLALAMAAATDGRRVRPPLELLFTVGEETGLTGATRLEPGFVQGRLLLNLDTEEEGVFIVGCAGGEETRIRLALSTRGITDPTAALEISTGGMQGGHSGLDIHKPRANAIGILTRTLDALWQVAPFGLAAVAGGQAHNAIPRNARAVIAAEPEAQRTLRQALDRFIQDLTDEYAATEPSLAVEMIPANLPASAAPPTDARRALDLMLALPHGAMAMSSRVDGLVETSCNLATVSLDGGWLTVGMSQRSSIPSRLSALTRRIGAVARLAGGQIQIRGAYPAWQPDLSSPLLERSRRVYRRLFTEEPAVQVVHAGLECGVIGARFPGMDMISFGPTLKNPHSPEERLHIPSVGRVWALLSALLEDVARRSKHPMDVRPAGAG